MSVVLRGDLFYWHFVSKPVFLLKLSPGDSENTSFKLFLHPNFRKHPSSLSLLILFTHRPIPWFLLDCPVVGRMERALSIYTFPASVLSSQECAHTYIIKTLDFFEFCLILSEAVYFTGLVAHTCKIEKPIGWSILCDCHVSQEFIWKQGSYDNEMQVTVSLCVLKSMSESSSCWIWGLFCCQFSSSKQRTHMTTYSALLFLFSYPLSCFQNKLFYTKESWLVISKARLVLEMFLWDPCSGLIVIRKIFNLMAFICFSSYSTKEI